MTLSLRAYRLLLLLILTCVGSGALPSFAQAKDESSEPTVVAKNLLREVIEGVADKEVIVNRVSFPPHTELPWHWHPGEEIFYVIEGVVTLKLRDQSDQSVSAGGAQKIAPEVIHTGLTGEEGAELVIFRVHTSGLPERYLAE